MSDNGNNIFQACSNVQVNGGSFSISGRDTNTQTVHYHQGSASHHFGWAHNVNTGMNQGHFAQGGSPGPGYPPRNNTYPGPYGGAPPPPPGWNSGPSQYNYQQYPRSPPAPPSSAPGTGTQYTQGFSSVPPSSSGSPYTPGFSSVPPSSSGSRNPYRQNTTSATPPRRPSPVARTSSDATPLDDVEVVDLDDVEDTPKVTPEAPQNKSTYTATWNSSHTSFSQRSRT